MINTILIGRIERYSSGVGDIEPLFLDDSGNQLPLIVGARALKQNFIVDGIEKEYTPNYKKGSVVAVGITQRDFTDAIQGRRGNGDSTATHDLSSAIILGAIT